MNVNESIYMAGWLSKWENNEDTSLNIGQKCRGGLKNLEEKLDTRRYNITKEKENNSRSNNKKSL